MTEDMIFKNDALILAIRDSQTSLRMLRMYEKKVSLSAQK